MREEIFRAAAESILKAVIDGKGGATEVNPALLFTQSAKNGEMDVLSDEDYAAVLGETEELAAWWHDEPRFPQLSLLQSLMETVRPGEEAVKAIVELLTETYRHNIGDFAPEISNPDYHFDPMPAEAKKPLREIGRSPFPDVMAHRPVCSPAASDPLLASPAVIYDYITERIHGQREACRAAASLLFHHVRGHRRSMLMVGPTGCGKTEIWRVCRTLYPNIIMVDTNRLTAEGWSGSYKVRDIFAGLTQREIEESIVVFDEFDKLCEPKVGAGGTNHSHVEQDALLKLIEGERMDFPAEGSKPAISFDSSRISYVFLGSFERLTEAKTGYTARPSIGFGQPVRRQDAYDEYSRTITLSDIARYSGMRREIAGRIGSVVQLRGMTEQDFCEILRDNAISPVRKLEREYGVRITLDDLLLHRLAREAADTRMGVRYLNSRVQELLDAAMFRHPNQKEYRIEVAPAGPAAAQNAQERGDTP